MSDTARGLRRGHSAHHRRSWPARWLRRVPYPTDGQGFSPDQRQDALAEYNFLQDRLDFWLAYDNKPLEAQSNLLSAAFNLYSGAVNGGIITIGRKDGELPASMLPVATGILAADNGTPTVGLRGPAGGVEVEAEPVPPEHQPASSEEEPAPSRSQLAPAGPHPIIEELTRTGELGDNISNAEAKIDWDSGTDKGLHWENYNEAKYPEFTRLKPGSKVFDFVDDASGEAVSDKALDPLCYSYINEPKTVYSTVKRYIDAAANYSRPRTEFDVDPSSIKSRSLRLAVRNYISPEQWQNLVIAQGGVYWGIGIGNPWSVSLMASKARTARLRPVSTTDLMSA